MKRQKGFSLIELLIVVAIILIIAAIAIPNLLKARMAANESAAAATVRTLATIETNVKISPGTATYASGGYGTLAELNTAGLVDSTLAAGTKSGYAFTIPVATLDEFLITAEPSTVGTTGTRGFCAGTDASLHVDTTGATAPATAAACTALPSLQ